MDSHTTSQPDLDIEQIIRDYLPDVVHMSLATCKDNKPWVCEVHFAYDDGYICISARWLHAATAKSSLPTRLWRVISSGSLHWGSR
ncbi:MAG TPA: hypothetical protein VKQ34_05305 [Candidatus Saccharimonadales bacterium]|nr:hypothetical protein [Candidatus Saccharimonadales bacterium]